MNLANQEAEALLALQQPPRIRIEWIKERQQWVAHYIGQPAIEGYSMRSAGEAMKMLKQRTENQ